MRIAPGPRAIAALLAILTLAPVYAGTESETMEKYRKILADPDIMKVGGASELLHPGKDGALEYSPDADGNLLCDFTHVGYRGGGVALPDVPAVVTLEPQEGDDTARIQAAIDEAGAKPVGPDGYRGAVVLKKGKYEVSNTLFFAHDGVVLRGEGAGFGGTWILHRRIAPIPDTSPARYIHFPQPEKGILPTLQTVGRSVAAGDTDQVQFGNKVRTRKLADIADDLVATGQATLTLSDVGAIEPGDEVVVTCSQTQKWIDAIGLSDHWKPEQMQLSFWRVVEKVLPDTKQIVLSVPLSSRIDRAGGYAQGEVHKVVQDGRVRNIGVENILFLSDYDRSKRGKRDYFNDEHHPNYVCRFYDARDAWIRRCVAFFYSGGIMSGGGSQNITTEDCAMLDGVSADTPANHAGARKYYFNANGAQMFFQRCYARYSRHAYIGNGPKDGAVFLDCFSEKDHLKSEWHQRWGHGHLFDNIALEAQIGLSGNNVSGHGQKGAYALAWNNLINNRRTYEPDLFVNKVPGIFSNYAIGNILLGSKKVEYDELKDRLENAAIGELGWVESTDRFVEPRSIYLAQLRERMGDEAVRAIATRKQIEGPRGAVWLDIIEQFAHFPEYLDPNEAPWPGYENWVARFDPPAATAGK